MAASADEFNNEAAPENPAMTFEVKLSQYDMGHITRSIAEQMAERVLQEHRGEIKALAREILEERVNAELEAAIRPIVTNALDQPLTRTDAFGKPQGEPKSAKDIIAEGAEAFLTQMIDPNGKLARDSMWNKPDCMRINRIVGEVIDSKFTAEMNASVAVMKRLVQEQTKAAAAAWLAKFQASVTETMKSAR